MRSLILSLFLGVAQLCLIVSAAQCPTLVKMDSTSQLIYDIYDCDIGSNELAGLLEIDAREAPALPSSSPSPLSNSTPSPAGVSVTVRQAVIWPSSLISILLPNSSVFTGVVPLKITIVDSEFRGGAGLQISGSLPPHSQLYISNNSFQLDLAAKPEWFVDVLAGVAYIALPDDYLSYLGSMSRIEISSNSFEGVGRLSAGFTTVGFSWRGSAVYQTGASVSLSDNSFTFRCESILDPIFDLRACVVGMHLVANQYFDENNTFLEMDRNQFNITGGFVAALPPIEVSGMKQSAVFGSSVSFSNNRANVDTRGGVGSYAISVGSFVTWRNDAEPSSKNDFVFSISKNIINITGSKACGVGFGAAIPTDLFFGPPQTGLTSMTSKSMVLFDKNVLTSDGCDVQIMMERPTKIADEAQISISKNSFRRVDETQLDGVAIVFTNSFTVPPSASLFPSVSVFSNIWTAPNTIPSPPENTKQLFGTRNFEEVVVNAPNGSIRVCSNLFYGIDVDADANTVKLLSTPVIAEIVTGEGCVSSSEITTSDAVSQVSGVTTNATDNDASDTTPKRVNPPIPTVQIPNSSPTHTTHTTVSIALALCTVIFSYL